MGRRPSYSVEELKTLKKRRRKLLRRNRHKNYIRGLDKARELLVI